MKIYGNTESRTRCKEDSWEATNNDTEGCDQEGTSAHSGRTDFGLRIIKMDGNAEGYAKET